MSSAPSQTWPDGSTGVAGPPAPTSTSPGSSGDRAATDPTSPATAAAAPSAAPPPPASLDEVAGLAGRIAAEVEKVVAGKPEVCRLALVVLLAEGHLLIEDVPGVGKTMLSKALARSIDGRIRRIQFTPDLLPSDVTGVSIYNQETRDFEFRPGGIFGNVVVGDEINRASPKTQSALLEGMEERQVTVDGTTYRLESPFLVVATQNPIEMEGTYALPEAQRDRFMARVSMGYPGQSAEMAMLAAHASPTDTLAAVRPVVRAEDVRRMIAAVGGVTVSEDVRRYAVALTDATRRSNDLRLGASPRATLHLVRAAKALAALHGRSYAVPDDVLDLCPHVLTHRLIPTREMLAAGRTVDRVLADLVAAVPAG